MNNMFDSQGKLRIPIAGEVPIPKDKMEYDGEEIVIDEAYCSNEHSLISDITVNGHKGIHFLYTNQDESHVVDLILSPVVGNPVKVMLKGDPFKSDEIIKAKCPTCQKEFDVLFNCECGAPIYLFYLDKNLHHQYGQSFCSRIGCSKSSMLRFSKDVLENFIKDNSF